MMRLLICLVGLAGFLHAQEPRSPIERGSELLFEGKVDESIEVFDALAKAQPGSDPHLWQRGIAYYLAGEYAKGVAQFERHQTVNPNDVENAAWHFICKARLDGVTSARASLIPIKGDSRIPMAEVHRFFAGDVGPDVVLKAAKAAPEAERARAICYAHQYLGLYYEVTGQADLAMTHMNLAAKDHFFDSYMGRVSRVHDEKIRWERSTDRFPKGPPYVVLRDGLSGASAAFLKNKRGRVAFIGGSITQADGWRQMVMGSLKKRFPGVEFETVPAGISSTCSTTGAFRFQADVLAKGKVDLLFIEFAVNDNQDAAHTMTSAIRGMEGMVVQAREQNPDMSIVISHFVNSSHISDFNSGVIPDEILAHEKVAEHYGLPTVQLAREVADALRNERYTFKTYGGVHPGRFGQQIYAAAVDRLFDLAWADGEGADIKRNKSVLLDSFSYVRGRYVPAEDIKPGKWTRGVPDWKSVRGNVRGTHRGLPLYHHQVPGDEMTLTFKGTAVGATVLAGPDAGRIEYRIDDGPVDG